jgi:protein-S-isoprenylcysteine O-methyltransferase Ste14
MEESKKWYQSKTILASIVTVIALIAGGFNLTIDAQTQGNVVELVSVVVGVIGSVVAIWGRIQASKTIK